MKKRDFFFLGMGVFLTLIVLVLPSYTYKSQDRFVVTSEPIMNMRLLYDTNERSLLQEYREVPVNGEELYKVFDKNQGLYIILSSTEAYHIRRSR